MKFYLYIIILSDKYIYTGITNNLTKRLFEHKNKMCLNTKNRLPIIKLYTEEFNTRIKAAKREKEIKGWRHEKKEKLINSSH